MKFGLYAQVDIGAWQKAGGLLGPLGKLQAGAGKNVPEPCVFPLARVAEAVEVKVPDSKPGQFVGFHDGISRAFNAALNPQSLKQLAHQCGLSGPQISMQGDECIGQSGLRRQSHGEQLCGPLIRPELAFYNRDVTINSTQFDGNQLVSQIQAAARKLGFSQIGVTGVDLSSAEAGLLEWLSHGFHGGMAYMADHGLKRARPADLVPGTISVITARMDYLPQAASPDWQGVELSRLERPGEAIVSMYARGRDYHKMLRNRLQKLAQDVAAQIGPFGFRVFTDSAPVLEVELAVRSGQGWRGKHTLTLNRDAGSMFFLGEIFVDIDLPHSAPVQEHCGTCRACIAVCPTQAIVAPYRLDARRCISYLTIEHSGPIPVELRTLIGNRIYGCDDCQLVCPWNKFARRSALPDFDARAGLTGQHLADLFAWTEHEFLQHTEGSPIRRIGHERWLRNVAVGLGNALGCAPDASTAASLAAALQSRANSDSALVREHTQWALAQNPF